MVNYLNGKIYRIVSDSHPELVYYGSTTLALSSRLAEHRKLMKRYNNGTTKLRCTSFEILQHADARIILVETCPSQNKEELIKRERYFIENNNCVNKIVPGRTNKEYYDSHKEQIRLHGIKYRTKNKETIQNKKKIYYEKNRNKILQHNSTKYTCDCGVTYSHAHKNRHLKSAFHQTYMNSDEYIPNYPLF